MRFKLLSLTLITCLRSKAIPNQLNKCFCSTFTKIRNNWQQTTTLENGVDPEYYQENIFSCNSCADNLQTKYIQMSLVDSCVEIFRGQIVFRVSIHCLQGKNDGNGEYSAVSIPCENCVSYQLWELTDWTERKESKIRQRRQNLFW